MKLKSWTVVLVGLCFAQFSAQSMADAADFVPGEVLVKYKEGTLRTKSTMNLLYKMVGVAKVRYYSGASRHLEQLVLNPSMDVEEAVRVLENDERVEYAQPNYIVSIPELNEQQDAMGALDGEGDIPCIPGFELPGCKCIIPYPGCGGGGGGGGEAPERPAVLPAPEEGPLAADPDLSKVWGLEKIGATQVWGKNAGDKKIIVAVIDTGVDYNHEDLAFNMYRSADKDSKEPVGYDFVHNDGLPYDDNMHGTHVAGTIGAVGNNGKAISGVSQRVSIMALKFLTGQGSGNTADAVRAIDYAVEKGAKILNNSWGGEGADKAIEEAVIRAEKAGVLFVAAAGNGNRFTGIGQDNDKTPVVPASIKQENMLAVAATDKNDALGSFSNFGKNSVHVAAPGVKIYSTLPGNKYGDTIKDSSGADRDISGTSMATPHVVGAAALIWAAHPDWNYKQVKQRLMDTVDKVSGLENKLVSGGRINVAGALRSTE